MKKFFPAIVIILLFSAMVVSQMIINGRELAASKTNSTKDEYTNFETQFAKFENKTSKGKKVKLKDIKAPLVMLNFWAEWCAPCKKEFPTINKLKDKLKDKIFILGINNDDNPKKAIPKTEKNYKLKFDSIPDPEGNYASLFKVSNIPTTIIYKKGKVIEVFKKEYDFANPAFVKKLEAAIE